MARRASSESTAHLGLAPSTGIARRLGVDLTARDGGFLLLVAVSIAWAWQPLSTVISRSLAYSDEEYSHIVVIPLLTAYLLFLKRDAIRTRAEWRRLTLAGAAALVLAAAALVWLARFAADPERRVFIAMLGVIVMCVGSFVLVYGLRSAGAVLFPLLFLLFMAPFPPAIVNGIIHVLQRASAEATDLLFQLIGMPFFRDGFVFALPGIVIEVAEQCSGIRSTISLVISGLTMAYLLLRSPWSRGALVLAIVPLTILKNAVRIVLLSWLAVHVDKGFVTGSTLHQRGGIPFFLASFVVLVALAWMLRRWERGSGDQPVAGMGTS